MFDCSQNGKMPFAFGAGMVWQEEDSVFEVLLGSWCAAFVFDFGGKFGGKSLPRGKD